ncbi:MAG: histidine decarboxylase, pyruvoyl type [Actinomycetota bacterium]|nr:histidine decarboxylase, pyruvoyl type [Actinomycetota bacterium]
MHTLTRPKMDKGFSTISYKPFALLDEGWREFSPRDVIRSSIGPDDQYCVGFTGIGGYCVSPVMAIGSARENFSSSGSPMLDAIMAYDSAEVEDVYIGQINMITVSSFCGPQGVIWGYDVARNEIEGPPLFVEGELWEFNGLSIKSGEKLRESSRMLFGTRKNRHFPLLPGGHVSCASKYRSFRGPVVLYAAIAIGIPEDRSCDACLLMEDVGCCNDVLVGGRDLKARKRIAVNMIRSVLGVGENQGISYREVIVDVITREIGRGEVGCALVAAPYFQLARKAYHYDLTDLSLQEWYGMSRKCFLDKYR